MGSERRVHQLIRNPRDSFGQDMRCQNGRGSSGGHRLGPVWQGGSWPGHLAGHQLSLRGVAVASGTAKTGPALNRTHHP
jgi:hypothetical protein